MLTRFSSPLPRGRQLYNRASPHLRAIGCTLSLPSPFLAVLVGANFLPCASDLDVDKGSIRIERSLEHTRAGGLRFKEPKTPDSVRVISLPAGAVEALKAHRVRQLEQRMMLGQGGRPELVFTTLDGDPITPDVLSKAWSRQTAAKGMPQVHFHALRHTHASMLISEGIDIVQISKRLGHASPTITLNTYSHLFKKDDDDLVSALEKALGGKI